MLFKYLLSRGKLPSAVLEKPQTYWCMRVLHGNTMLGCNEGVSYLSIRPEDDWFVLIILKASVKQTPTSMIWTIKEYMHLYSYRFVRWHTVFLAEPVLHRCACVCVSLFSTCPACQTPERWVWTHCWRTGPTGMREGLFPWWYTGKGHCNRQNPNLKPLSAISSHFLSNQTSCKSVSLQESLKYKSLFSTDLLLHVQHVLNSL